MNIEKEQISLSLHWERDKALPQIDYAGESGYGLEILAFSWSPLHNDENSLIKRTLEIKADVASFENNLSVHGPIEDVIPHSQDAAIREIALTRINRTIEIAKELKARRVVFHSGINTRISSPIYYSETIKRQIAFWDQIAEENPEVLILIENMWEKNPDILIEIVGSCSRENLKLCFDVAHMNVYGETTITEWLEKAFGYTCHYHLNDNSGDWDSHLTMGCGTINWMEFKHFEQISKTSQYVIELEDLDAQKTSISYLLD